MFACGFIPWTLSCFGVRPLKCLWCVAQMSQGTHPKKSAIIFRVSVRSLRWGFLQQLAACVLKHCGTGSRGTRDLLSAPLPRESFGPSSVTASGGGQGLHLCHKVRPEGFLSCHSRFQRWTMNRGDKGSVCVLTFQKVEDETCLCYPVTYTMCPVNFEHQ